MRVLTDNTQVLSMVNTGRSSSVRCMFWIRELFWVSVIHNFDLVASHIGTDDNVIPDFLSRYFDPKSRIVPPTSLTLCCFQGWMPSTELAGGVLQINENEPMEVLSQL